jgi:hypothetical protein
MPRSIAALVRSASLAACFAAVFVASSGCSSERSVSDTVDHWSSDQFVPVTDRSSAARNAARVLHVADQQVDPPAVLQVGSLFTVIFESPDASSRPVARVPQGGALSVDIRSQFIRVPTDALMNEATPGERIPTWLHVTAGSVSGWVSARSMTDPRAFALRAESLVAQRRGALASEGNANTAMPSLAASTPAMDGANYRAADRVLEVAAKPARFRLPGSDPFAWSGRLDGLPVAGAGVQNLDKVLASEAATLRERAVTITQPEPPDPKSMRNLMLAFTDGIGDDAVVKVAVEELVRQFCRPVPIGAAEERVLGRECLAAWVGNRRMLNFTNPMAAYVNWVGNRIAARGSLPYPSLGLAFVVVDDDSCTETAAIPGGPVLVTTGLLRSLRNEHELAAVLAHEIAHIEERHGVALANAAEGEHLNAMLQVFMLEKSGQLDEVISAGLTNVPPELQERALDEARTRLHAFASEGYPRIVRAVMAGVRSPSQGDEVAADLRGMSLAAAAGWSPRSLEEVLCRSCTPGGHGCCATADAGRIGQSHEACELLPKAGEASASESPASKTGASKASPSKAAPQNPRWARMVELLAK